MQAIPLVVAVIVSLLLAFALGSGWGAMILFLLAGLGAGFAAGVMPPGSERIYWGFVLLMLVLILANLFGIGVSRFLFILPIAFVASYFAARLARKVMRLAS